MERESRNLAGMEAPMGEADFGFRTVPRESKASLVRGVFDSVAERYDLMNDLMSGGAHRLWKAALVDWLRPRAGMHLLDLAGGTGDIAERCLRAVGSAEARVTVADINESMLAVGRRRAQQRSHDRRIAWLCTDAERLPMTDRSVDAVTIAFGIRNCTNIEMVLREARRVLRPGGRFLCLEFSRLALPGLESAYDAYSFRLVPLLGRLIAKDRDAYQYLVESIRRFPPQDKFATLIETAGLAQVKYRNLSGGIAAVHSAWRV